MKDRRRFFKMHVCGNDFMVINATSDSFSPSSSDIQQWSDRRTGIGFDQLLVLNSSSSLRHDFQMVIYNSDGGTAMQCGNGCAAVASLVADHGLVDGAIVTLDTAGGTVVCQLGDDEKSQATIELPPPILGHQDDPRSAKCPSFHEQFEVRTPGSRTIEATVVSMGNPHAVIIVDDTGTADLETLGRALQQHAKFPDSVNVEVLQCLNRKHGRLRIYERGVGETLSCGSGACAAMVAGWLSGAFDDDVEIQMPGGCVNVQWEGPSNSVRLSCRPTFIYEGVFLHD